MLALDFQDLLLFISWDLYLLGGEIMADYDYRKGKERIEEILDNELTVVDQNMLPKDESFTFCNGYYSRVTGIFVDIRDS